MALDPSADASVGSVVRACVGNRVFERLVDPLLGGVNAGRADDLSCEVMAPQLLGAARSPDGMLAGLRRSVAGTDPTAPVFHSPRGGMERLVDALTSVLGDRFQTGVTVTGLSRGDGPNARWLVSTSTGTQAADAVVLAVPAHIAADLVASIAAGAGTLLAEWQHASVALATIAYDRADLEVDPAQSGFLVGRSEGLLMTAGSFAGSKGAHLDHPERTVLRVSCGRIDDTRPSGFSDKALLEALRGDLATTLGVEAPPTAVRLGRFPDSLVQFPVGHSDRINQLDGLLADSAPGVLVAGSVRTGVGIPACIRSGTEAARQATELATELAN